MTKIELFMCFLIATDPWEDSKLTFRGVSDPAFATGNRPPPPAVAVVGSCRLTPIYEPASLPILSMKWMRVFPVVFSGLRSLFY